MPPCLIFEDDDLLVVNKPAGLNTHAPSPYAGEGLYDWLRHREQRWTKLAIIHRLDKETSGVMVFAKTPRANRSLTAQFTDRTVRKKYVFLTDRPVPQGQCVVKSCLVRAGERYVSRPLHAGGQVAETVFREGGSSGVCRLVEAEPLTGRTHQIRVHAAEAGFPVLGDTLYGGTSAPRVYLHAAELRLKHPASGKEMTFRAPLVGQASRLPEERLALELGTAVETPAPTGRMLAPLTSRRSSLSMAELADPQLWLTAPLPCLASRQALIVPAETDAYRLVHGASDGWAGWYVDRLGDFLLSQSAHPLSVAESRQLAQLMEAVSARGAYHKMLTRQVGRASRSEASPQLVLGQAAPDRFTVRENGLRFELSFGEGYSIGLFLDQRDNRRRLLTRHVAAGFELLPSSAPGGEPPLEVLNTFAYTCGFSVCAAKAGARTTSLDLSKRYLEWGKRNFTLNELDPTDHEFLHGDVFDWLRRLARKGRRFDVILLDPPTFSRSKDSGVFQVEKDYGQLTAAALPLLKGGGVLFASTNAADWPPEQFLEALERAAHAARREILQRHYVPQPPDFPISRAEPAYLKTAWLRVG